MSLRVLGLIAVLILAGARAEADGVRFGLQGNFGTGLGRGFNSVDGGDTDLGVGVRVIWELGLEHEGLAFEGSVDFSEKNEVFTGTNPLTLEPFSIGGRYWEVNVNATYARGGKVKFYCGLGVNLANDTIDRDYLILGTDSDPLDVGGNLLGGFRFFDHVFTEARVQIEGGGQAMLTIGLLL